MSKLIPQELLDTIPNLYETEESPDPMCHVKFFMPDSNWTWYVIECSTADRNTCFGYVQGFENELGYFWLDEIESIYGLLV